MTSPAAGPVALCVAVLLAAISAVEAQPKAFRLAPHRAVYDMSLEHADHGSGITAVQGRLVFEVRGSACTGYTVNMRFVSRIQSEESITVSDLQSATYEAGDASSYRFVSRSKFDERSADETDGSATRRDGSIRINLAKPEEAQFTLDGSVMFPTEHLRRVIRAARTGKRIVVAQVYDGSDTGRKIYDTTTVIGDLRKMEPRGPGAEQLQDLESWPITIAYFDPTEGTGETPSYEFSYDIFENGVSTRIELNYGQFSLGGDLTSIEFIEADPCEPQ